jgi:hypothetical protein
MPWNLLLLPLIGGYYFIHRFHWTRFRATRTENQRLLIESAVAGVFWLVLARVLVVAGCRWAPGLTVALRDTLAQLAPMPYAPTALGATVLEVAGAHVLNWVVSAEKAAGSAIRRYGDELQNLLFDSLQTQALISVTLGNGKVYIGAVTDMPNLDPRTQYVALIPMFSGYRDPVNKRMQLTTSYWPLYDRIATGVITGPDLNDFEIIIPAAEVKSANRFDPDFYKVHFGEIPAPSAPNTVAAVPASAISGAKPAATPEGKAQAPDPAKGEPAEKGSEQPDRHLAGAVRVLLGGRGRG